MRVCIYLENQTRAAQPHARHARAQYIAFSSYAKLYIAQLGGWVSQKCNFPNGTEHENQSITNGTLRHAHMPSLSLGTIRERGERGPTQSAVIFYRACYTVWEPDPCVFLKSVESLGCAWPEVLWPQHLLKVVKIS